MEKEGNNDQSDQQHDGKQDGGQDGRPHLPGGDPVKTLLPVGERTMSDIAIITWFPVKTLLVIVHRHLEETAQLFR